MAGVTKVNEERWRSAQQWELRHWVNTQKQRALWGKNYIWRLLSLLRVVPQYRGDDWNVWWARQFDNYNFLPPRVERAIELGCGPYTNMRLIVERCKAAEIVLSDPLIESYLQFELTFLSDMIKKGLCVADGHPAEDCPFPDQYFDLVVMINVLDHVRDAEASVRQAMRITSQGGILLLGQDLSNESDIRAMHGTEGEEGHPIKIDHHFLESMLAPEFVPIVKKILPREMGRAPEVHYGTYVFAGRRESPVQEKS